MLHSNRILEGSVDEIVARISTHEPHFAKRHTLSEEVDPANNYEFDDRSGYWTQTGSLAKNEAILICGGSLLYDRRLEQAAFGGDSYNFKQYFSGIRKTLASGDLAIASLNTSVAEMYPGMTVMTQAMAGRGHYLNAKKEYLDGIRFAGFDALALANGFNLDTGVRGALATEANVKAANMVPSGLGRSKSPIFEVNGIKVAVLSYTLEVNLSESLTGDGRDALLNIFNEATSAHDIHEVKTRGADFVLCYVDGRTMENKYSRKDRELAARILADAGAGYVICTQPSAITRYTKHDTPDGRTVPIASGLGTLMAGTDRPYTKLSALLRIVLSVDGSGDIAVTDSYVPTERYPWERGGILPVAAAHKFFGASGMDHESIEAINERMGRALGRNISVDVTRRQTHRTPGSAQFSPAEISQILGTSFTPDGLEKLGTKLYEPLEIVATYDNLREGTCAVLMKYSMGNPDWRTMFRGINVKQLSDRIPTMIIAREAVSGLPTLVVKDPWRAYQKLVTSVRAKYQPVTIAVTGTAGKTTTKEMLSVVLPRQMQTLFLNGNWNTEAAASSSIMKLTAKDEAFIHEVHGATPGSAIASSRMVKPNIAIITSIAEGHLEQMGSIENIVEGKLGIIDGLSSNGVLILNNDNEYLRKIVPEVRTIRFGIDDTSNDYYARNVVVVGQTQKFEIVDPDGLVHQAELNIPGLHNVSNALATFAAAREAAVPAHKIIAGLSRYRSSATRQNIQDVGGYRLFIDAYNSNVLSLSNALDTLEKIDLPAATGRRIIVMGDMGEQGDKVKENHVLIGEKISKMDFDLFFGVGEGTKFTADVLEESQIIASHSAGFRELVELLSHEIFPGDVILFKAAGSFEMAENVVFPLFGRIV